MIALTMYILTRSLTRSYCFRKELDPIEGIVLLPATECMAVGLSAGRGKSVARKLRAESEVKLIVSTIVCTENKVSLIKITSSKEREKESPNVGGSRIMPNQVSTPKRADAYVEIALRTATSRIDALEKELHDLRSIVADHDRRRHEAESKACTVQRKAQDLEVRFNISDKRRKDAEKKTRELETQITEAISTARQSEGTEASPEDTNRFDRIREVFDNQAFEESKRRADAEHRAHEVMKKRAEAEAKCLEETERRVQAEIRAKQEMRIRIDEEMRNKALRSKLKDAEEKLKTLEQQKANALNAEKRKKTETEEHLKTMLKHAHQSSLVTEQKKKEAEFKSIEVEQKLAAAEDKFLECDKKLEERNKTVAELQTCLDQARLEFDRKSEYSSKKLEESSRRLAELQVMLDSVACPTPGRSTGRPTGRQTDYANILRAIAAQELNYVKLGELQTLNADLEVTIRELKESTSHHQDDDMKISTLIKMNAQLETIVEELKQKLEHEEHAKIQLHLTIEELEDTIREQTQKLNQLNAFEGSRECRRIGDSLVALRVEENPLFRPEPVTDDLQRNFSSRPDSVTDDSQMSPRDRPQSITCKSQQISFSSPAVASSDSETNLMECLNSDTEDGDDCLYRQEKQSLAQKLSQTEALVMDLSGRVEIGRTKQSQLEFELKEALQSREAAEIKADALLNQLELAVQREKEKEKDFLDLSGTTSFRGKKEKWGILDRFRSKIKSDV